MKRRMREPEEEPIFQESLFGDAQIMDISEAELYEILSQAMETSQSESVKETPTEADVLNIYKDVSKLADIERYLNVLYRPFTCFLDTKCQYNLRRLRRLMPGSSYDPDRHMALMMTHLAPMGSVKIYANGNILCQAFNRRSARRVLANIASALGEVGGYTPSLRKPKFNLVNATFCMPFPLDLQALNVHNKPYTVYVPKKQPFLTYRMPETMIKFAIFPVGYVYVLFSTRPKDTQRAIAHVLPLLYLCQAPRQLEQGDDLEVSRGDINFKLLWEREFQKDDDFAIQCRPMAR